MRSFSTIKLVIAYYNDIIINQKIINKKKRNKFYHTKTDQNLHCYNIIDDKLSSLAILSVENACVRSLEYNGIIDAFATAKAQKKIF